MGNTAESGIKVSYIKFCWKKKIDVLNTFPNETIYFFIFLLELYITHA